MAEAAECGVGVSEFLVSIDRAAPEEVGQEVLGDGLDRRLGRRRPDETGRFQDCQEASGAVRAPPANRQAQGLPWMILATIDHGQVLGGSTDQSLVTPGPNPRPRG